MLTLDCDDGPMEDQYLLLITHAQKWAEKSKRPLDADLLGTILSLRDFQDRMPGTSWPEGSVEYLMTVRWPAHGPLGVPDVDALVETLDTFWRFLRSTGRMASGSADPKELTREAKRSKGRMQANCEAPESFSSTKVLQSFGEEIGISLSDATSADDVQDRFARITDAWNALPMEERRARMPGPPGGGSALSSELSPVANEMLGGLDLNAYAEQHGYPIEDTWDPREDMPMPAPADIARVFRGSPFFKTLERLLEWIGESGRQVTANGYLKPALAREIIDELGLDDWMKETFGYVPTRWRSASEHLGLDRLMVAVEIAGLVEVQRGKIVPAGLPTSDETWAVTAIQAMFALADRAAGHVLGPELLDVLMVIHLDGFGTAQELKAWWRETALNPLSVQGFRGEGDREVFDKFANQDIDKLLAFWKDTNIIRTRAGRLEVSALGMVLARAMLDIEEGV